MPLVDNGMRLKPDLPQAGHALHRRGRRERGVIPHESRRQRRQVADRHQQAQRRARQSHRGHSGTGEHTGHGGCRRQRRLARCGVAVRWRWCPDAGLLSRRAGGSLSRHIYAAVERDDGWRRHGAGMGCLTILIVGPDWSWTPGFACAVRVLFSDSGLTPMRGRNGAALRFCG